MQTQMNQGTLVSQQRKQNGNMADVIFPDGMIVKKKPNAPDFVKCSISFKVEEFIQCLRDHDNNGWVNMDLKVSKAGKLYADIDNWKPDGGGTPDAEPAPF